MSALQGPRPHLLLDDAHKELGLHGDGVVAVAVAVPQVQGVDVVGAAGGDLDHRAAQGPGDGAVLPLGVDDDDIVVGAHGHIGDRALHAHGFAGAGHAQDKGVGGDEALAVTDQGIFGNGVDAVVQAAGVLDLLGPEGHEDGGALGGQGPQGPDPAQAIGQHRVQPVFLLVAQNGELAQMVSANGHKGLRVHVQLFQGIGDVDERDHGEDHPLVSGGQVVQELLGLPPHLLQLVGHHGGEVVVGVLLLLPAGHVGLHGQDPVLDLPHRLVGGDGQDVDGQHEVPGKVAELRDHVVPEVGGVVPQEQHPPHLAPHLEVVRLEGEAVRADQVPEVHAAADGPALVEGEIPLLAGAEEVVEDPKAVLAGEGTGPGIQPAEALGQVALRPAKEAPGGLDLPLGDGQGDELVLDQVIALGHPVQKDLIELPPVSVQRVSPLPHEDGTAEDLRVQPAVADCDLGGGVRGQGVEHAAVGQKDGAAVLVGGGLIIDVREAPCPAELPAHQPDAVPVDPADGDGPLDAVGDGKAVPLRFVGGQEGLNQSHRPPSAPGPGSRDLRSGTPASRRRETQT